MSEHCYVGIDLGGTTAKAIGLMDGNPGLLHRMPTVSDAPPGRIFDDLTELARRTASGRDISALGIAMPGLVDPITGRNAFAGNLHWQDVCVREEMQKRLGVPVAVENDANAAALGEHIYGTASGARDFIFISLGTGIGSGIFVDGRMLTGSRGAAGEIGHIVLNPEGPPCSCGSYGCLEALAGGWAIIRDARAAVRSGQETKLTALISRGELLDVKAIADVAREKDAVAQQILDHALQWLGLGVVNVVNLLNPELVVIGGGLSHMGGPLLKTVRDCVLRYGMPVQRAVVRIELSQLEDRAGALGAVELARSEISRAI